MANERFLGNTGYRQVSALSGYIPYTGATANANLGGFNMTANRFFGPLTGNVTGNVSGNAATVTTNANLTGPVTSVGNATSLASSINLPGNPTTTTQSPLTNNTTISTTAYVDAAISAGGFGTVSNFSFTNANGISGVVSNPTSTPDLTLSLGAITPTSVVASGSVSGSNLSGTNTGDQTISLTGGVTGSGTGSFVATVITNANLTGPVTSVGNATTITNGVVTGAMLSGTGAVRDFGITITGGASVVATGAATASVTVPFTGTITKWYLSANQSGSVVVDVKRGGTSIVGSGNLPTLSSQQTNSAAVSGWTSVAVTAGDVFTFNVNSSATLTSVTLVVSLNIT